MQTILYIIENPAYKNKQTNMDVRHRSRCTMLAARVSLIVRNLFFVEQRSSGRHKLNVRHHPKNNYRNHYH